MRLVKVFLMTMAVIGSEAFGLAAVTPTAGMVDQSQGMIQEDQGLRQQAGQEKKFFVAKILIKGPLKLSDKELKDIIGASQQSWLVEEDIDQIMHALRVVYVKRGADNSHLKITHELKKSGDLEIAVDNNIN